ncbi:AAA family ATPase [Gloeobacter violaceus]|uniref:Glr1151 protein n=1 Tax=Gloeobacter violaceus (strain ATCC 29082 / PCC 7421) TaxID=251221 RepID=Q7NLH2_GLOVI|nr:AAA family ATPase [Gloeobacter violaceus]BAC89092.1 glr1151 [Gloeobacter violaceus PCC 7421]
MKFIESLRLDGLLSFAPDSPAVELTDLNIIIGPNGSGKSNFIEAIELLRATPTGFASAIRDGGGVSEWLWKGNSKKPATIDARLHRTNRSSLRYMLSFTAVSQRTEIVDELIEEAEKKDPDANDVYFYYRFQKGRPVLNVGSAGGRTKQRRLERDSLAIDESVLSQRKDPEFYPELSWCAKQFGSLQMFREWSFGRYTPLRQPQPADLPTKVLLEDSRNLGLILNQLEHSDVGAEFNQLLQRFLPRYQRLSTLVQGATVQFFLHEENLNIPIPATRLSDGTIRFLAMLALLLMPDPPPLICIEEPELGLHPDAMTILAELFVSARERTQLIITTHSDALVSALTEEAESVLVCEYRGGTILSRLESDKLQYWLNKYRLGELWRMGELGGNL